MAVALLLLIAVAVLVVLVVRKTHGRGSGRPAEGHTVRRFFQYLLLYGLLVVVALGLAGLLGRLLERNVLAAGDEAALARDLAFTVVGVPLFVAVALWTRRRFTETEAGSLGWACYATAATLTCLVVAMTSLGQVLAWAVGLERYDGHALAGFLVWGGFWGASFWVDAHLTPRAHASVHYLAGSLAGLVTAAVGLAGLLAGALRIVLGLDATGVLAGHGSPMLPGLVTLLVGAPVWVVYWPRAMGRYAREPLWVAYVLLAGVAGGLVTAIASASTLLYTVLVWLVGEPVSTDPLEHFHGSPTAAAAATVGVVVWGYHQEVLRGAGAAPRTEVRRIYEYLMAGIGLVAAASGLTTVFVAGVEAFTPTAQVIAGRSVVNTLLAAATLLAVGTPVWWVYWRHIQTVTRAAPQHELASPTRRVYLLVLFGLGGIAAVIALLVGVYLFFQDVVAGRLGAETLRSTRFAIGVLLTTAAIASYHWTVYQDDRRRIPPAPAHGPAFVLLVGPADAGIVAAVARHTHGRVQAWTRADSGPATWPETDVLAVLDRADGQDVIILLDAEGVRTIPVHRTG